MLPVPLRVDQLKLNHMYNIINGIAPSYLKSEISIAGHTSHVTRSGNRACFVPRVNSFAIKSFFYTGLLQVLNSGMLFPVLAHSHENGAIFNLKFHKHTTTEIGWQFAYKQHFLKVANNI